MAGQNRSRGHGGSRCGSRGGTSQGNARSRSHPSVPQALVPGDFWFGARQVSKVIGSVLREHYKEPTMNWKETSKEQQNMWFDAFKAAFSWSEENEDLVRAEFEEHAGKLLKCITSRVGVKGERPHWMHKDVYAEFLKKRAEPEFIERSNKAKQNKMKDADEDGVIRASHHMGSISAAEVARKMTTEQAKLPSTSDLFFRMHSVVQDGCRTIKSKKAQQVHENLAKKKSELLEKGEDIQDDVLYFEVVGGRKKGKVYGLGSAADIYYKGMPSSRQPRTNVTSYAPGLVKHLEDRAAAIEKAREEDRHYFEQQLVTQRKEITEQLSLELKEEMRRQMDLFQQQFQCHNSLRPPFIRPDDPFGDGSSSGTDLGLAAP